MIARNLSYPWRQCHSYEAAPGVWGSLRHDPTQPTQPVRNTKTKGHNTQSTIKWLTNVAETTDILSVWWYLDWDAFSDVQNKLHIGVVVVVSPSWHRHVMICHFDVLWERQTREPIFFPTNHSAADTSTTFLTGVTFSESPKTSRCTKNVEMFTWCLNLPALAFRSSGVTITTKRIALSLRNIS